MALWECYCVKPSLRLKTFTMFSHRMVIFVYVPHGLTLCLCPRSQPDTSGLFWVKSPGEKKKIKFLKEEVWLPS